jgi:hypothetical protein
MHMLLYNSVHPWELQRVLLVLAYPQHILIKVQALPNTEFAWFIGLNAAIPEFIPSSFRIGPFTISMLPKAVVEGAMDDCRIEAIARITGKYSGLAPAITATTAISRTVYLMIS